MTFLPVNGDLGLFVKRLTFGSLTFSHGYLTLERRDAFASDWWLSRPVAALVMLIQPVGRILIFIGCMTQIPAFANLCLNVEILYVLIAQTDGPVLAAGQQSRLIDVAYLGVALALPLQEVENSRSIE